MIDAPVMHVHYCAPTVVKKLQQLPVSASRLPNWNCPKQLIATCHNGNINSATRRGYVTLSCSRSWHRTAALPPPSITSAVRSRRPSTLSGRAFHPSERADAKQRCPARVPCPRVPVQQRPVIAPGADAAGRRPVMAPGDGLHVI